ncbi:methionine aminotransferase [Algoriphagus hitonicola]|uniref:2-keto-4-methylthiobutyrate aminotransferase apoenzyme n=1 Tax=Algoriphagus hitonicola TaxID=435880 RepID=A0A1I2XAQ9_9BACT|nr:methionine aminotransferase [Algoriphagus hitonicola]SFH10613.1 2-keto-4-methylthiobutyrate aminotransferase apoenzyme [Algoriphagus hitonicola]
MNIRSKLPNTGTTIFTIMSQMAKDQGAINLSQGFPGFDADSVLLDLVAKYIKLGHNQYAPMSGIESLRKNLAIKTEKCYGFLPDYQEEVTIVSGATEALFAAISTVIRPGDEALILEPAYDSYEPAIILNGGIPIHISLNEADFSVNWDRIKSAVSFKTKLIVVNSPHNPTGYVWTAEDLKILADLIRDRNIFVVSDEVYEHITFDGRAHLSLLGNEELRKKTFVCGSFGKTFHVTGWKVGYCIAPKELTKEFRKIHQFLTFSTVTPIQFALAEYLENPDHYQSIQEFYEKKRNLFLEGLKQTKLKFSTTQGSFFQMASYGHLSKISDQKLAELMCKKLKVACIPVSSFYHNGTDNQFIRFCFAKEERELEEAMNRLLRLEEIL